MCVKILGYNGKGGKVKELSNDSLKNVVGGISLGALGLILTGIISFAIGILDGIKRPKPCRR